MSDAGTPRPGPVLGGIVLAGGRSSRFGSDKLRAEIGGEPLLWRPIRALAAAGCADIVVVVAPEAPEPDLPIEVGSTVRFARDPEPFGGPLVGLRAGLAATDARRVLVAAGDQPDLAPALFVLLAGALDRPPAADRPGGPPIPHAAVLVDPEGVARPLPCLLDCEPALAVADRTLASGRRSLRDLLGGLGALELPEAVWRPADPGAAWTRDVDTPEDRPPG
jgi:molybdopterin-guanine dinucleotide biosynthesis protein A